MAIPPTGKLDTQHTLFGAKYRTEKGLQLQNPPFAQYAETLSSSTEYDPAQLLGGLMRNAGVDAFEFISARDPARGINVALFMPTALQGNAPLCQEAGQCELTGSQVSFHAAHSREFFHFP